MWQYRITTGAMTRLDADGSGSLAQVQLFRGYSGAGHEPVDGRNNPLMCSVPNRGPIPPGSYTIRTPYDSPNTGPYTMALDPSDDTNTFGRSLFRIHGNNAANDASHGCIILPPDARRAIWTSGDNELRVIA